MSCADLVDLAVGKMKFRTFDMDPIISSCSGLEKGKVLLTVLFTLHVKPNFLEPLLLPLLLFLHNSCKEA